jgi:hypothetical protein
MNGRPANKMKWYRMPRCTTALYDCLLCSTEFYCCPLCPTFGHIIGCFWPLSRGKSMYVQEKLRTDLCGKVRKITATGGVRAVAQNLSLVFCFSISKPLCWRRVFGLHPNPTRRQGFLLFLFPGARAILPLVVELPQGARSWNGLPLSTKRST